MKNKLKNFVLLILFTIGICITSLADQPNPPDPGGNPIPGGGTPVGAPIDDGVVILIVLGVTYGAYKIYEEIKNRKNPNFMKKTFYLILFMMMCNVGFSQTTYTWIGSNNGNWQTGSNWNPTRNTPQNNDQLVISTNSNITITNVPNQIIGSLYIQKTGNGNDKSVILQSVSSSTTLYITTIGLTVDNKINLLTNTNSQKVNFKLAPITRTTIMGTFDGYNLTLESNSTNTASILSDTTVNDNKITLNGTTKVEQYIKGGQWHYITSPIPNAVSNTFLHDYLRYYDEVAGVWSQYIVPTNIPLPLGRGYEVWSSDGNGNSITKVDTFYTTQGLNNGQIQVNLTRTPNTGGGYNLIGNPYPSAINWESQEIYVSNMLPHCWVLDYDVNGNYYYKVYIGKLNGYNSDSTNGGSRFIAPMQGFFVKVDQPYTNGYIQFNNNCRRHNSRPFYKEITVATPNSLRLKVEGNNASDETVIKFNNDVIGNPNYWMVEKWMGSSNIPQIYSLKDNEMECINTFPESDATTVKVGLVVGVSGSYILTATQLSFSNEVTLEDTKLNKIINLKTQPIYTFTADTSDIPNRFLVHFGSTLSGVNDNIVSTSLNIYSYDKNVYITNNKGESDVYIYDVLGKEIQHLKIYDENNTIPTNVVNGTYIVRVVSKNSIQNKKVNL
jgi:hypothetical protein